MKYLIMLITVSSLMACNNSGNVKVPDQVNTTVQVQPVTGEIIVKHVITMELPTIFTDTCRQQHLNDQAAYNDCVVKYINELIKLLNSINPGQLPVAP